MTHALFSPPTSRADMIAAHPRRMMWVTGPIVGVISGLILGVFSWIASKIVKPGAG